MAQKAKVKGVMGKAQAWSEAERLDFYAEVDEKVESSLSLLRKADVYLSTAGRVFSEAQSILRRLSETFGNRLSPRLRSRGEIASLGTRFPKRIIRRPSVDRRTPNRSPKARPARTKRHLEQLPSRRQNGYAEKPGGQSHEIEHGT